MSIKYEKIQNLLWRMFLSETMLTMNLDGSYTFYVESLNANQLSTLSEDVVRVVSVSAEDNRLKITIMA